MTEPKKTTEQNLRKLLADAIEKSDYVNKYQQSMRDNPEGFIQFHGPYLGSMLASLSADRQEKLQKKQNKLVSDSLKSSSRFGMFSLGVSIAAFIVAALSIYYSNQAIRSSSAWQAEQTPLLQKIVENTKPAEPAK